MNGAVLLAAAAPVAHPHRGDLLDLVLIVIAVLAALAGFRRGLLVGALSLIGFAGGAALGSRIAPSIASHVLHGGSHANAADNALGQRLVALVIVFGVAVIGEVVLVMVATRIRRVLRLTPFGIADAAGGALLDVVAVLVVAWLLATAVAVMPSPKAREQVRRSAILNAINSAAPSALHTLSADLVRLMQQHALPAVTGPFGGSPEAPADVPAPDAGAVDPALGNAGAEVLKIVGTASCSRVQQGSGFVVSSQHVLTNAHVVAGVRNPSVELPAPGAATLPARVVLYDPNRDVAVLYVPGLTRRPLPLAGTASIGASAVVAGYPENGPLRGDAARVAGEQDISGPNIYANRTVTRQIYTLKARVRPGNSGGPLLTPGGAVYGVVFATSVDDPDTGYALTNAEVHGDLTRGSGLTTPVSTGGCD